MEDQFLIYRYMWNQPEKNSFFFSQENYAACTCVHYLRTSEHASNECVHSLRHSFIVSICRTSSLRFFFLPPYIPVVLFDRSRLSNKHNDNYIYGWIFFNVSSSVSFFVDYYSRNDKVFSTTMSDFTSSKEFNYIWKRHCLIICVSFE